MIRKRKKAHRKLSCALLPFHLFKRAHRYTESFCAKATMVLRLFRSCQFLSAVGTDFPTCLDGFLAAGTYGLKPLAAMRTEHIVRRNRFFATGTGLCFNSIGSFRPYEVLIPDDQIDNQTDNAPHKDQQRPQGPAHASFFCIPVNPDNGPDPQNYQ